MGLLQEVQTGNCNDFDIKKNLLNPNLNFAWIIRYSDQGFHFYSEYFHAFLAYSFIFSGAKNPTKFISYQYFCQVGSNICLEK